MLKLAATKPLIAYEVQQKLTVLEKYMSTDEWADRRDWLILASLKRRGGGPDNSARRDVPLWWLLVLLIRLKLAVWRYLARRGTLRLMRRLLD